MENGTPSEVHDLIHQAVSIVSQEAACPTDEALERMHEVAAAERETLENIARGVLDGSILFRSY